MHRSSWALFLNRFESVFCLAYLTLLICFLFLLIEMRWFSSRWNASIIQHRWIFLNFGLCHSYVNKKLHWIIKYSLYITSTLRYVTSSLLHTINMLRNKAPSSNERNIFFSLLYKTMNVTINKFVNIMWLSTLENRKRGNQLIIIEITLRR